MHKTDPKSSSYRLSCIYFEGGIEVYGQVVRKKGKANVTPFWGEEEEHIWSRIASGTDGVQRIHDDVNPSVECWLPVTENIHYINKLKIIVWIRGEQ